MAPRALVTRSGEDAESLAVLLRQRGLDVSFEPLLTVAPRLEQLDLTGVQAVLLTSANGARAFAADTADRHVPVFTVGDATARTARALGFEFVESAGGDVTSLAALIGKRLEPDGGDLLHAAGSVTAGDLGGTLTALGFSVRKVQLYDAVPATALSKETADLLRSGGIDIALFYSPRTAATFADLLVQARLENSVAIVTAYCLSEAVGGKLSELPWLRVRVAVHPDQDSLLALLDEDLARMGDGDPSQGENDMTIQNDSGQNDFNEALPDAEAAPVPAVVAPPHKRAKGKPFLLLLGLLAVATGAAYATLPQWRDRIPEDYRGFLPAFPQEDKRLAQLDAVTGTLRMDMGSLAAQNRHMAETVARLEQRLDALERSAAEGGGEAGAASPAQEARDTLSESETAAKIAAVADRVDVLAKGQISAAAIASVHERIAGIEDTVRRLSMRQESSLALVLAVAQLREAVYRGSPFEAELQTLAVLAPDPAALSQTVAGFAAFAPKGMLTRATLERQFEPLSAAVAQAAMAPEGSTWLDQTLQRLAGLVTLRRTDGLAEGDSTMAAMARAGAHMEAGNLADVVAEMSSLTGAPARVASGWLEEARARVAADRALSSLTAEALGRTAAAKAGG